MASSSRVGRTLVKPLGLPREGHSAADQLSYGSGREDRAKTEGSKVLPLRSQIHFKISILPDSCWATPSASDPKIHPRFIYKILQKAKKG